MWTAIHVVEGNDAANKIKDKLSHEGFLVKVRFFCKEGETENYEILVPEFEAQEAYTVLFNLI